MFKFAHYLKLSNSSIYRPTCMRSIRLLNKNTHLACNRPIHLSHQMFKDQHARGEFQRGGGRFPKVIARKGEKELITAKLSAKPSTESDLNAILISIDRKSYGSYRQLGHHFKWEAGLPIELFVDHIQSDPYAPPSRFHVRISMCAAGIPATIYGSKLRITAFCDFINRHILSLVRKWRLHISTQAGGFHGPKGGDLKVYEPKQQVLERSSCTIVEEVDGPHLELRFQITLPANGRSINGLKARQLLLEYLPRIVEQGMVWRNLNHDEILLYIRSIEVQEALRNKLVEHNLIAFIGNGSILPRESRIDPRPMSNGFVKFRSPQGALEITIDTGILDPNGLSIKVTGMGIPKGITVISGGGFHGKSTLLEAIELGVYNVVPGDGRELVVTHPQGFKIRAEDGRSVIGTNISPFINGLPHGASTVSFSSGDSSGSTSMAANIQEALEIGARLLVIDEDISATNLLVRDVKMEHLIRRDTIEPFIGKVGALYTELGVSTIIVVGSCGDYLNVAHTVIGMDNYIPEDWSKRAKEIASKYPNAITSSCKYGPVPNRIPDLTRFERGRGIKPNGIGKILLKKERSSDGMYNDEEVDLVFLEQLVEIGQSSLCCEVLLHISAHQGKTIREWANELETKPLEEICKVSGWYNLHQDVVRTRPLELLGSVNRFRGLAIKVG